jgi:hypothetical protein
MALSCLGLAGWDCADLSWEALTGAWLETIYLGERSNRGRVQINSAEGGEDDSEEKKMTVFSTLQPVPLSKQQAEANVAQYLRLAFRTKFKERLIELELLRKNALVASVALPAIVQAVATENPKEMLELLNENWRSDLVNGVTVGMHNIPQVLQLLVDKKMTIKPAFFLTLVCGKSQLDNSPPLWGGGKMASMETVTAFCPLLVQPGKLALKTMKVAQNLLATKPPGMSGAIPGARTFNKAASRFVVAARKMLGLVPIKPGEDWKVTAEVARQARAVAGSDQPLGSFAMLLEEYKSAHFMTTKAGVVILWQLGPYAREEHRSVEGYVRYSWPDAFVAVRREWHVRTFFRVYKKELPFVQQAESNANGANKDVIRGWQLPQAEVDKVVGRFLKHRSSLTGLATTA